VRRAEHGGIFLRLLSLLVFVAFLALLYVVRHPLLRLAAQLWLVDEPAEAWMQSWSWAMTITRETARLMQRSCIALDWPTKLWPAGASCVLTPGFPNNRT